MRNPLDIARMYLERPDSTGEQLQYAYTHRERFPKHQQPWILETIARNPSCPPKLFAKLLPQVRDAALSNPAWLLYLLEGDFLTGLEQSFIQNNLRDETAPLALIEALALHPVSWIASAARQHVQLVKELGDDWQEQVLADWTTRLWRDSALVWLMRAGALPEAVNQRLPYPILPQPRLSEAESQRVVRELALQKGISLAIIVATAQVTNPPQALTEHVHWERRLALALNPGVGLQKRKLQCDGHVWVRAAARQHLADPDGRLF